MQIQPLCAVPELADQVHDLIRATWPDHYVTGTGNAAADIADRMRAHGLPFGLVAVDQGQVIGTAALTGPSFGSIAGEDVWIGGLAVTPKARGLGYASGLVQQLTDHAESEGFSAVHTTTAGARGIFLRQGWSELRALPDDGGRWCVLRKILSAPAEHGGEEKI
jgi:predicted N-acetyltransferase YhbS